MPSYWPIFQIKVNLLLCLVLFSAVVGAIKLAFVQRLHGHLYGEVWSQMHCSLKPPTHPQPPAWLTNNRKQIDIAKWTVNYKTLLNIHRGIRWRWPQNSTTNANRMPPGYRKLVSQFPVSCFLWLLWAACANQQQPRAWCSYRCLGFLDTVDTEIHF